MTEVAKDKYSYSMVTVGERGQIVIPKTAPEHFAIKPRDQILVSGDLKNGMALSKAYVMKKTALSLLVFNKASEDNKGR
ncbi:MAG: AbrB/MazE/SpoVT family DNA-binding domain-containing protein [Candidatus Hermodarchaeota archaeon]|nr:AbrB/MazE/SpoVT family DNA-binding domain-containing protein [Candidatus Hermodarchaeota archaeon]